MNQTITVLGKLSKEEFLADYWQKKPVVIRNAFADFEMPFTAEELAGLTLDTDAPARMIIEHGLPPENKPWQVKLSPFSEEDFTSLPDSHCTFLVNDLERYIPELGNLIEPFRFIPDWRIDDLMVSYAEDQGSVGPHTDDYDVFLIQGQGKRRWKVITREDYNQELIPDLPIALLKEFEADQEWLLEAGDMLYLPPNMPHYGIAEGACFTFSVGFRAPQTKELVQSWLETFDAVPDFKQRFTDAGRTLQTNPGEIKKDDLEALSKRITDAIEKQKETIPLFLGKYLSESKGEIPIEDGQSQSESFLKNTDYERESWLRIIYIDADKEDKQLQLFANGHHIKLPKTLKKDVQELCENYYYTAQSLQKLAENNAFKALFDDLIQEGGVYPV